MRELETIISARSKDLGGFEVRRVLPHASHRMVGPFIFFDHMGPAQFQPGHGLDVRPHPHIHLATVTYLFEGAIRHRDSLGSDQLIEPGAINWMVAGRGIVHSERSPDPVRKLGGPLHGIQIWVALPRETENCTPHFEHVSADKLPLFSVESAHIRLLLGSAFGHVSPVTIQSDLFYMDVRLPKGTRLTLPAEGRDGGVYVVEGQLKVNNQTVEKGQMGVGHRADDLFIESLSESRAMLLGGTSLGPRFIDWNFISSRKENIDQARADWSMGPGSERFPQVPGDETEFIPLPEPQN
jgi:redox-sensitive bicupin YhaK (pirin superfamily)